eukprot:1685577-Prymnesium_polylepis.1
MPCEQGAAAGLLPVVKAPNFGRWLSLGLVVSRPESAASPHTLPDWDWCEPCGKGLTQDDRSPAPVDAPS